LDMLATVRNILDDEERKDRALRPASPAIAPPPAPPPPPPSPWPNQPRLEPQLRVADDGKRSASPGVRAASSGTEPRLAAPGEWAGSSPVPPPRPMTRPLRQPAGFTEPPAPPLDLELQSAPQPATKKAKAGKPKPSRASAEPSGPLAKLVESIPQKARLARGEFIQIRLGKEEAAQLLARAQRRGAPAGEGGPACRAVTIRLSAPEGGFFIETGAPETQWIVNRPASAGEEPFGTWSWAVVPNETGSYPLSVSISARDLDAKGFPTEIRLPEQTVKIRIRGNFGRTVWTLFRALLLLALGSGLTVAAWFLLKALGKLPH
jgi:neural Wiskott-Aldrich syndrome protein